MRPTCQTQQPEAAHLDQRRTAPGRQHRGHDFDIPYLIEYLSSFMTLQPGDMIATGTPEGLADVVPGDEVVVEVEGVGRLVNRIVSEADFFAANKA
jgi:2-keto-4-pentenoate hydratase/2-oxohepta-3-ene-1,7-dioic acid hydratase in catechol pathway